MQKDLKKLNLFMVIISLIYVYLIKLLINTT